MSINLPMPDIPDETVVRDIFSFLWNHRDEPVEVWFTLLDEDDGVEIIFECGDCEKELRYRFGDDSCQFYDLSKL